MSILESLIKRAQQAPGRIVLTEGEDDRIITAAAHLTHDKVAKVTLLGNEDTIEKRALALSLDLGEVDIINPETSELRHELAALLHEIRLKKGMTAEKALELAGEPLWFANLLVKAGHQDGVVSGAVHTSGDVVRTAIQVIGVDKGFKLISSFFMMILDQPHHPKQGGMVFTDCALMIDPNSEQLAEIASAAANSYQALSGKAAKVAMLSFSTNGSAEHEDVTKMAKATALVKKARPDLSIDGEVQLDAAVIPSISARKVQNSEIDGDANVLVFPSLEAGNIGYKLVERFSGAKAIGPLLQGLAKPANDLSRGCSAEDVYYVAAATVVQGLSQDF